MRRVAGGSGQATGGWHWPLRPRLLPNRQLSVVALALAIACVHPAPLTAQTKSEAELRLEATQQALQQRREAEQGLTADIGQIRADRERLNQSLVDMARQIQAGEGQLTTVEGRLGELEVQETLLRGSLSQQYGSIARLLSAMQRMGRNPPPVLITQREDALVMVRSAMMLAAAFPQLKTQALALAARLDDLARVMGEVKGQGEKLRTETQRLTEARTRLSELLEAKRQSLGERQEALDRVRREATEIARNVTDLNDLISKLDKMVVQQMGQEMVGNASVATAPPPTIKPPVATTTTPGPSEVAALPASKTPNPVGAALPAPPETAPAAVVLQPRDGRLANLNPGRIKPAIAFAEAKARLPLPAQGRRIIAFGDKAQTSRSNGIVIETRSGAQVTSPADGWIVFAGVFRSYGQILIINGGDGYHILLAGLSQIDAQLGQFVLAGEPVGLMSGSDRGAKAKPPANAPVLYVEFRKDGRPIDPDPWWTVEGTQKVQG